MFSATLHSPEIRSLAEKICAFPTWVDLKGKDSVPDTVHHLLVDVDPTKDRTWGQLTNFPTDEVHIKEVRQGKVDPSNPVTPRSSRRHAIHPTKDRRRKHMRGSERPGHGGVWCRSSSHLHLLASSPLHFAVCVVESSAERAGTGSAGDAMSGARADCRIADDDDADANDDNDNTDKDGQEQQQD